MTTKEIFDKLENIFTEPYEDELRGYFLINKSAYYRLKDKLIKGGNK